VLQVQTPVEKYVVMAKTMVSTIVMMEILSMGTDAHQYVQLKSDLDARVEIKLLQINALKYAVMDLITAKISAMMAIV
jgi:cell division protein FtsL